MKSYFPNRSLSREILVYFLVFLTTVYLTGCNFMNYNRLNKLALERATTASSKYIVVHLEKDVWHLVNPRIVDNQLVGTLDTIEQVRRDYLLTMNDIHKIIRS